MRQLFTLWMVLGGLNASQAQTTALKYLEKPNDLLIGVNISSSRYAGDLSEQRNLAHLQLGWAAQAHVRWRLQESICIRADVGFYHLRARQQFTRNAANRLAFFTTNFSANQAV